MRSTTQARRSIRAGGWLAGALLVLGAAVAPGAVSAAAAAEVDSGDIVYIGSREGYGGTGIFPIWSGGVQTGEPDYWAYCIEHAVSAKTRLTGSAGDLDTFLGDNHFADPAVQGKVLWVLANSYPAVSLESFGVAAGAPGISRNDAIEATQYAIWRYTDLDFDASWSWETPDSEAAYWYLVDGANAAPALTREDLAVTAAVAAPSSGQRAGTLVGPFTVSTDRAPVAVSVDPATTVTDATGAPIDVNGVVDGQELYLDLRETTAAGNATVRVTVDGSRSTGAVISVPGTPGTTPTAEDHAQSIILVAPYTAKVTAEATVAWAAQPVAAVPAISTSLVDAADGDQVLAWNGGTVTDTVAYENLVPGTEYTVRGELKRKRDGSSTGITGSTTFIPAAPNGTVSVPFTVPEGFAGETLVAFEELYEGRDATGILRAEHKDIDDAAQTVTVQREAAVVPATPDPAPDRGGSLAATGSATPIAAVVFGLLALVAGAVLMHRRTPHADV